MLTKGWFLLTSVWLSYVLPFGEVLVQSGTTINDYLFAGEQFDQNLGVYYLRTRYYDQGIGRFIQMDTWMGNSTDPVTLHKYLYGNVDPVNFVDPSGNFSLGSVGATNNIIGVLATASIASYSIGQSLSGGGASDGGFNSNQLGWLVIAGMSMHNPSLTKAIDRQLAKRKDSNDSVILYRSVEDVELASMYGCKCFSLGPSAFPKQFFHTGAEAIMFGDSFILGSLSQDRYHLVSTRISRRMYNSLDHNAYEPGIGSIVTVPNGLLPAFNFDTNRYGGWVYIGSY